MSVRPEDPNELIAELRRKLAEAEDTLAAIRDGQVDALVVRGADALQISTIEDETAFRRFLEAMAPGAIALDDAGHILYANTRFANLLGQTPDDLQGKTIGDVLGPGQGFRFAAMMAAQGADRQVAPFAFIDPTGGRLHFEVSMAPLRLGTISGHAVTFTDITERLKVAAAEQSERAARAVIASANEAVVVCDTHGVITHANAAAAAVASGDLVGRKFAEAFRFVFPQVTGLMQSEDLIEIVVAGDSVQGVEAVAPDAKRVKDFLVSAAPLRMSQEEVSGCVVTMTDLSQRKAAEKHQLLLMAELDHRVKNTLALVQSISRRTLSSEDTLEGFRAAFSGRIQALAATHNLLAERSWANLQLREVIYGELSPYTTANTNRIQFYGLDVSVAPRAAIALALIVHELTTNAVKYGALSGQAGTITVSGSFASESRSPYVLEWRERGGPAVEPPKRLGFGNTVITRSFQYSPEGSAELRYEPEGVVCVISVPSEDVA